MRGRGTDSASQVYPHIDFDTLDELAETQGEDNAGYWEKCKEFWDQVKDKPISRLSLKQQNWLDRIDLACQKQKEGH